MPLDDDDDDDDVIVDKGGKITNSWQRFHASLVIKRAREIMAKMFIFSLLV
jgi:hypothetical protein